MSENKTKEEKLSSNFWKKSRPSVSFDKVIEDVTPIEWDKEILDGKKNVVLQSVKNNH